MSGFQHNRTLAPDIPRHDQDPVGRRRLLNILAQRRYRLRRRERLQERDIQAEPEPVASREITGVSIESHTDAFGLPESSENPLSQSGTTLIQYGDPFAQRFSINALGTTDQDAPSYSSPDIEATIYNSFGTATTVEDTLHLPLFQQDPMQDPLGSAGHGPASPVFLMGQNTFQTSLSSVNPELNASGARLLSNNAQIEPAPASPFADYAITTPGLSVICAKVNIFNNIVGPGYLLDIWDLGALSPICLGAATKPCPANFQPTPLQRSIQHHPIIDVFPWASFRDRFLYTMSLPKEIRPRIAQDDMPIVNLEVMLAAKDATEGIRVWGSNAFLAENWEIGQTFYSKFWWAIDASIVRSSNQHRERRGAARLRFDFSDAT